MTVPYAECQLLISLIRIGLCGDTELGRGLVISCRKSLKASGTESQVRPASRNEGFTNGDRHKPGSTEVKPGLQTRKSSPECTSLILQWAGQGAATLDQCFWPLKPMVQCLGSWTSCMWLEVSACYIPGHIAIWRPLSCATFRLPTAHTRTFDQEAALSTQHEGWGRG